MKKLAITCLLLTVLFSTNSFSAETYTFERLFPALQQPWYFDSPNGVAVDDDNFVYVTDTDNHRVLKFSADGQFVAKWGKQGGKPGEFNEPHAIATDRMGFVYVADAWNYRIQKFTSDGEYLSQWKSGDGTPFAPMGIAADRMNFIYAVNYEDGCVHKYSSDGKFVKKWRCQGTDKNKVYMLFGIAADDKGFIYVSDTLNNKIQKFTANGDLVSEWGNQGKGNGELNLPSGIAADHDGYVYVSEKNNDRIQKFSSDGKFVAIWGSVGSGNGQFISPTGIAISRSGVVYVAEYNNHRIQVFSSDGVFQANWESRGSEPGKFDSPEGIAADSLGNIYVVDKNNNRIQKFSPEGKFVTQWNGDGTSDGKLNTPFGIAVYGDDVYVTDTLNNKIRRFDLNGQAKKSWGSTGSADGQFDTPMGVAVSKEADEKVYVYVTDWKNYRVQKFDADGNFQLKWGVIGNGSGTFKKPDSIVVNNGYVYVTDRNNHLIQTFDTQGVFKTQIGGGGVANDKLSQPIGVTVNESNVYVADSYNQRIQTFTADGQFMATLGAGGTGPGQFNYPVGLCFGTQGRLYVSDSGNNRIQVFNTISTQGLTKAIIIAGKGSGDRLWDATRLSADFAYRTLTYQGVSKENIRYLTSDTQTDLDNDGEPDPVFSPSVTEVTAAFEWAKDADQVVLYMVDHGGADSTGTGIFRLNAAETLSASQLTSLSDTLTKSDITAISDFCRSGLFMTPSQISAEKKRILISSTLQNEDAHFVAQGTGSFSYRFWANIFNGSDIKTAFEQAKLSLGFLGDIQHPQLDATGDGIDDGSYDAVAGVLIGNGSATYGDIPVISELSQVVQGTSTATLSATVTDTDGIARVWAMIRPPAYLGISENKPVLELPFVELKPAGSNRYEGRYDGFDIAGNYSVAVFAKDKRGNISLPKITSVSAQAAFKRRAILVNGAETSDPLSPAFVKNISLAYHALSFQGYADEDIRVLSSAISLPITVETPTISNLQNAIKNWAAANTSDIVIYLIGKGKPGCFQLNKSEMLSVAELGQWINQLQAVQERTVTAAVIMDIDYSGSFLSLLKPDAGKMRILIASASDDQPAAFPANGQVSFSGFFWDGILNGESIGKSFFKAKEAVMLFSQNTEAQAPRIDDNGNGIGNERADGVNAMRYVLGAGIQLAGNSSVIGTAGYQFADQDNGIYLYASDISSADKIEKVWAVIAPPVKDASVSQNLPVVSMTYNAETKQYKGFYNQFPVSGVYTATIYAMNTDGSVSTAKVIQILQEKGADVYENDNAPAYAADVTINDNAQQHNFHHPDDADWLKFYAVSGTIYSINIRHLGSDGTMRGEIYNQSNDLVDFRETSDAQREILWDWRAFGTGRYYLKLFPKSFGKNTAYTVQVYRPAASFVGYFKGTVTDAASNTAIEGVTVTSSANASAISRPNGNYTIIQEPGSFILTVQAPGYQPVSIPVTLDSDGATVIKDFKLVPVPQTPPYTPPVYIPLQKPVISMSVFGTTAVLSWNVISDAKGYRLLYRTDPNAAYASADLGNITTVSGALPEGMISYVAVQAYNDISVSDPSDAGYISIPVSYLNIGHIGDDLKLSLSCAQYQGKQYQLVFNYSPTSSDPTIWRADSSLFRQIQNSRTPCLAVGNDLKLNLNAEYGGIIYAFTMNYGTDSADPLVWKMDLNTLKKK